MAWRHAVFISRSAERTDLFSGLDDRNRCFICWAVGAFICIEVFRGHFAEGKDRNKIRSRRRGIENAIAKLKVLRPDMVAKLESLRVELLTQPDFVWMHREWCQLIFGDVQHVLPHVLDRIFREGAHCSAAESNRRIGQILHHFFRMPERAPQGITRPRETAAVYKQLHRHRESLSGATNVGWQVPTWRWDPVLNRLLRPPTLES